MGSTFCKLLKKLNGQEILISDGNICYRSYGQLGNEMRLMTKGASDEYIFTDVTEQKGVKTTFLDITD